MSAAAFFLVARVGPGCLQYLAREGQGASTWTEDDERKAMKFTDRNSANAAAARHPGSGVVIRLFPARFNVATGHAARTARQRRAAAGPGLYLSVTRKVPAKNGQKGGF